MFLSIKFIHWLVILSLLMNLGGSFAYIRDTFKGKTKPNKVSWFVWALAPILGTVAALQSGADPWATARVFLAGFMPLLVLIVSFMNPHSYWKLTKFDYGFGIAALLGILLWIFADSPRSAILFLAIADGLAALPTIIKAWRDPESETGFTFLMGLIGVLLVIPSIPVWNIENSAFQIYLLIVNTVLVLIIYRPKIKAIFNRP
jgi:hypothetical protein